jgi:hypothetical protein
MASTITIPNTDTSARIAVPILVAVHDSLFSLAISLYLSFASSDARCAGPDYTGTNIHLPT